MTDSLLQHLTPDEVELWAQGLLPAARDAHLAQCAECRTIAERERKLIRELSQLTRFAPEFGCVERVMAKVKIPTPSGPHLRPHTDAYQPRGAAVAHRDLHRTTAADEGDQRAPSHIPERAGQRPDLRPCDLDAHTRLDLVPGDVRDQRTESIDVDDFPDQHRAVVVGSGERGAVHLGDGMTHV